MNRLKSMGQSRTSCIGLVEGEVQTMMVVAFVPFQECPETALVEWWNRRGERERERLEMEWIDGPTSLLTRVERIERESGESRESKGIESTTSTAFHFFNMVTLIDDEGDVQGITTLS